MDTIIRKTGKTCRITATSFAHPCHGDIVEQFTLYTQRTGQLVVGGPNSYDRWIKREYYCSKCGLVYKSTFHNELKTIDDNIVLQRMRNSYEMELSRNVYGHEILPKLKEGKNADDYEKSFQEGQRILEFHSDERVLHLQKVFKNESKFFLIIKKIYPPVLLDQKAENMARRAKKVEKIFAEGRKMFNEGKRKTAQKYVAKHLPGGKLGETDDKNSYNFLDNIKIDEVKIPRNAVPAVSINVLDNELNIWEYWIPADAVKPLEKE